MQLKGTLVRWQWLLKHRLHLQITIHFQRYTYSNSFRKLFIRSQENQPETGIKYCPRVPGVKKSENLYANIFRGLNFDFSQLVDNETSSVIGA